MSGLEKPKKNKSKAQFWRALAYLGPHRTLVIVSILCALVVGTSFTTGLGTMLPIMRVLISGESIQDWLNRRIIEDRLEMSLSDEQQTLRVARVEPGKFADRLGLGNGQVISLGAEFDEKLGMSGVLAHLASPQVHEVELLIRSETGQRAAAVALPTLDGHLLLARRIVSQLPADPIKAIAVALGFMIFLAVFGNSIRFFQEYFSEKAAVLAVRDIRRQVYDHVLHLRMGFFGTRGTSDVTSRLTQEAQGLQDGLKGLLGSSVQESIKASMALGLAVYLSWQLTLFILIFAPLMFIIIKKFGKKIRRATRAALENSSQMLGQIDGSLAGIRVVKANNAERFERRRFRDVIAGLVREQLRVARIEAINTPVLEVLTLTVVCCVVLYASYLVLVLKTLDVSEFFTVMAALMMIGESLRKVSKIHNLLQKSNASAGRLFEVLDLPVERKRWLAATSPNGQSVERPRKSLTAVRSDITFDNITFTYPGAAQLAIRDVSLAVKKGQSIAIVGRNGSGKTTLLALLPRFYDPDAGTIRIDGTDIRQFTLASLRRQIGIVTQDSVIFPGTIAENIAYGLPLARREQIISAAQRAFAHDFILEKPNGYDTVLGGQGGQLSGGQRQRLCIARAILRQTPILILDEATSQVDAESEHLIQQAIESLMHERTTFVIAHRFSTILSADSIVVMDRGEIVGAGSHQELLSSCATYQQLYERQIVGATA